MGSSVRPRHWPGRGAVPPLTFATNRSVLHGTGAVQRIFAAPKSTTVHEPNDLPSLPYETQVGTSVEQALEWLRAGETVALPTETVYGLAGNALDAQSVARIFAAKNRPSFDPLLVHVDCVASARKYAELPDWVAAALEKNGPGPLTFVVPKKDCIPDLVTSGLPTVGIRIPNHPLFLDVLRQLPFPLAAPSANPFGYISPTTAQHVLDQLYGKIPYILDGGACAIGVESTIVDATLPIPTVVRLGGTTVEQVEALLGRTVDVRTHSSSRPQAPGLLESHYAPRIPLILVDEHEVVEVPCGWAVVGYRNIAHWIQVDPNRSWLLTPQNNDCEAAANLFAFLRAADSSGAQGIVASRAPHHGLGPAINDRLQRAAHFPG